MGVGTEIVAAGGGVVPAGGGGVATAGGGGVVTAGGGGVATAGGGGVATAGGGGVVLAGGGKTRRRWRDKVLNICWLKLCDVSLLVLSRHWNYIYVTSLKTGRLKTLSVQDAPAGSGRESPAHFSSPWSM